MGSTKAMTRLHESNGRGRGNQYLRPQIYWLVSRKPTAGSQEANGGGLGTQRLGSKNSIAGSRRLIAGVQEQELRPRESKVRVQEINGCGQETNGCWGTGNQWRVAKEAMPGPRKPMAGAQETSG